MFNFDKIVDRENTRALKLERRKLLFNNENVIPLWVADMDFEIAPAIQNAIKKRINHPVFGYSVRPDDFLTTIQNWQLKQYNWQIDTNWIEFSPGVVPSLGIAVQAFTQPGEGVIIQPPIYPPFFGVVKDFDRKVVENPLKETENGYEIDFDHFEEVASDPNNRLFLLCHPHNPVGRVWKEEELRKLGEICVRHNVIIISDEIHCDLTLFGHKHIPLASISKEISDNTVTCMSPSKTFNLAGFSTAYIIASNSLLLKEMRKYILGNHLHMGNTFGALALEAAYDESDEWHKELIAYIEANAKYVKEFFENNISEVKVADLQATYLMWLDFRAWGMRASQLREFMANKAGIGLNDGLTFGKCGEGFMRLNIASPRKVLETALEKLVEANKNRV